MNQYVSTYQKEYGWPHVSSMRRPQPLTAKDAPCTCIDSRRVFEQLLDLSEKSFDWTRMDPMKRPLDPKLCSTKIGLISKTDAMLFEQPRTFLQKLEERCPEFEILKRSRSDERTAQVDADRMKTTYQVDYSDPAARMTQLDKALALVEMDGRQLQCQIPVKITIETDCPPHCRPPPSRHNGSVRAKKRDYKQKNGIKCGKKQEDVDRRLPSWKTEYQGSISRIGEVILKTKLHHAKKHTVPMWVTSN